MKARLRKILSEFFFKPASPRPLAVLRILLSVILLLQAFDLAHDILELYSRSGLLQGALSDYMSTLALPNIDWLQLRFAELGLDPRWAAKGVFGLYLFSLGALLVGWRTRWAAAVAWLSHFVLIESGFNFAYGVDHFANIFLFYFIWMPMGADLSLDRLDGRESGAPSSGARLALRVLQYELCVVYFTSGIHKAMGEQWWNGEAIWRALSLPMHGFVNTDWLSGVPMVALLLCWGTLFLEIGYPVLMFTPKTRKPAVAATVLLHAGIALGIGLVSFSATMAALTFAMFGISAETMKGNET